MYNWKTDEVIFIWITTKKQSKKVSTYPIQCLSLFNPLDIGLQTIINDVQYYLYNHLF